jgi:hypothetical protein
MDSGSSNLPADDAQNANVEEFTREILVPHLLDPDPFNSEDEVI